MSRYIATEHLPEHLLVQQIKEDFRLNKPPFDNIDQDLILLALIAYCQNNRSLSRATIQRLKTKFGTCDHQTLEFYGDRFLYAIAASLVYELFGLNNTPQFLTNITRYLTTNRFLTDLMLNRNACRYVRSPNYNIVESQRFHNPCADTLEALIGAFYIHLYNSGTSNLFHKILYWLLESTDLAYLLRNHLTTIGVNSSNIYTMSDKNELMQRILEKKRESLAALEALREDLDEEFYLDLKEAIERKFSQPEFADATEIVEPTWTLAQIYQVLNWEYPRPIYNPMFELYEVYGYPGGKYTMAGQGVTVEEAERDAREYLTLLGYIINMKTVQRHFA